MEMTESGRDLEEAGSQTLHKRNHTINLDKHEHSRTCTGSLIKKRLDRTATEDVKCIVIGTTAELKGLKMEKMNARENRRNCLVAWLGSRNTTQNVADIGLLELRSENKWKTIARDKRNIIAA
eukprot:4476366-Heterocapsa_arctica.AAC.1